VHSSTSLPGRGRQVTVLRNKSGWFEKNARRFEAGKGKGARTELQHFGAGVLKIGGKKRNLAGQAAKCSRRKGILDDSLEKGGEERMKVKDQWGRQEGKEVGFKVCGNVSKQRRRLGGLQVSTASGAGPNKSSRDFAGTDTLGTEKGRLGS